MSYIIRQNRIRPFKLIEGKNGPTTFLPLNTKIGGWTRYIRDKAFIYLMDNQARHVYKKVQSESVINIDTVRQKLEQDVDKIDDTSG